MQGKSEKSFRSIAFPRTVAVTLIVSLALQFARDMAAVPYFEGAVGFRPFDDQLPLTPFVIAIQLGAYDEGAASAYVGFAMIDVALSLATAIFFMALWSWMLRLAHSRIFEFLKSGGILLTPLAAFVCNVASSVAFLGLITGILKPYYAASAEVAVFLHRLNFAFEDIRIYFTLFFVSVIVAFRLRMSRAEP